MSSRKLRPKRGTTVQNDAYTGIFLAYNGSAWIDEDDFGTL